MKIVHLTLVAACQKNFLNHSRLFLWIEAPTKIKTPQKDFYPYQVEPEVLGDFLNSHLNMPGLHSGSFSMEVPLNALKEALPSPSIFNVAGLENHQVSTLKSMKFNGVEIDFILALLKELNFAQYYFPEEILLADDARFWIEVGKDLSHVLKQHQYAPEFSVKSSKKSWSFFSKWAPVSEDYHQRLRKRALGMPKSACSLSGVAESLSILEHFSELATTEWAQQISLPKKYCKPVEETLIMDAILGEMDFELDVDHWKKWRIWRDQLSASQLNLPFKLTFRLSSPETEEGSWTLEVLLQSQKDLSFMVDLAAYFKNKKKSQTLYDKMFGPSVERNLLLQLGYAARLYPPIDAIFDQGLSVSQVLLTQADAYHFLKEGAWVLHASGCRVIFPAWWSAKGRLKAKIKIKASQNKRKSGQSKNTKNYLGKGDLVRFDYRLAMGSHEVTQEEWNLLLNAKSELVFFRGEWVEVDASGFFQR